MTRSTIGDSPRRREDARFITGGGAYLDDLPFRAAGPCRRPALAACACLDPRHRRRRRPARAGRAGRPDGGRCGARWAGAAAPLCRSQRADRRAVRLRAPAADRRRQGALCRRSRWRSSSPRPMPRRSMRPSWSRSTTSRCPPSRRARPPGRPARRSSPTRCRAMSASTGTPAMPPAPTPPSPRPRMSSTSSSTIIASSSTRWSRAVPSDSSTRRAAATRCTSPARTSTSTAITSRARWASPPRMCASSRPMSAAASAPRTSPTPSTPCSCGPPSAPAGR